MNKDICNTSLEILKEKISPLVFSGRPCIDNQIEVTWFPDIELLPPHADHKKDVVYNCVLTGNFIKRLLESETWPKGRYRFWVLSQRSKDVLMSFGLFQDREIQVVPRHRVFKYANHWKQLDLKKKINFVFAGRVSPTKNVESILLSTYFLQKKYQINCQLHIIGPTDNIPHPDRGRFNYDSYIDGVKELSSSLDWVQPPTFYSTMESQEWLEIDVENRVLVNHSTFICEDFNVSLAQAQNQGWPSIISSFGGNTDKVLNNSILLSWNMIARSDESKVMQHIKSQIIASYIHSQLFRLTLSKTDFENIGEDIVIPYADEVSFASLSHRRRRLLANMGISSEQSIPNDLASLAATKMGNSFFSHYRQVFGTIDFDGSVVIIVNDLNDDTHPKKALLKKQVIDWIEKFDGLKIFLIFILDLGLPENIYILTQADKVCFPFLGDACSAYLDVIKQVVPDGCEFHFTGDL